MKNILLLLALLIAVQFSPICTNLVLAQEIDWQNTIGGSGDDGLQSISKTSDGGYICGGYSKSPISGDKTAPLRGQTDYWIIKLDSAGNILWQKAFGGSLDDWLYSIEQTSDGGYICGGWSLSNANGDKTENCKGSYDYWILKLNSSGDIEYQKTLGGNGIDQLYSIRQTADGGYICGGWSESNVTGDKTEPSNGGSDYWVIKLDTALAIEWQNTIGGNNSDLLYDISQTADGGFICGGYSKSNQSGDKADDSKGLDDYWVIKLDPTGSIQWQKTIGGSSWDYLKSVSVTADGGYVCGGHSNSEISGDKIENCLGNSDYWVVKLDSLGTIEWQNTIGGSNDDILTSVVPLSGSGYMCGGYSNSNISGDKTEYSNGSNDMWVIRLDSLGNILWQNTIGGSNDDWSYDLIQVSDGTYMCGGLSNSGMSGDKSENSQGLYDFWVANLTDKYNALAGKIFIDSDSNGIQDVGEFPISNNMISSNTSGRIAFSKITGEYLFLVLDTGSVSIEATVPNYYSSSPIANVASFSTFQQIDSLNDFAIQPIGVINDLCVSITPTGLFRSGFSASYLINYQNYGNTTLTPTIIFYVDTNISYTSASPTPTSVTTDSIVWNFGPLNPFQSGQILVNVTINLGLTIGTIINSAAAIEPIAGDANPTCNLTYWEVLTTGSFDPNDILVSHDTLTSIDVANGQFLDYIIRFQNTGNDTAFTVKVLNPIDTNFLDLNSFRFLSSSNPVQLTWINWEKNMEFLFTNILLARQ